MPHLIFPSDVLVEEDIPVRSRRAERDIPVRRAERVPPAAVLPPPPPQPTRTATDDDDDGDGCFPPAEESSEGHLRSDEKPESALTLARIAMYSGLAAVRRASSRRRDPTAKRGRGWRRPGVAMAVKAVAAVEAMRQRRAAYVCEVVMEAMYDAAQRNKIGGGYKPVSALLEKMTWRERVRRMSVGERQIRHVLKRCIHGEPEHDELRGVVECCKRAAGERQRERDPTAALLYGCDDLARAVHECEYTHLGRRRVLLWNDFLFTQAHEQQSRAQVLRQMAWWAHFFRTANGALLALCVPLLALAATERATLAVFDEAVGVVVCASVVLGVGLVGAVGSRRLHDDLLHDADGKETLAQQMIAGYFWTLSAVLFALLVAAASLLAMPSPGEHLPTLASHEPERFQTLARMLGVDTAAGTDAVARVDAILTAIRMACGVASLGLCALMVCVLYAAAQIVTVYEVVQGMLRALTALYLAIGTLCMYLGVVGLLVYHDVASGDLGDELRVAMAWTFVGMLVLGCLLAPVAALGLLGAHLESPAVLRAYESFLPSLSLLVLLLGVIALVTGSTIVDGFVASHCAELVQRAPAAYFGAMGGGLLGCVKYYGPEGHILVDGGLVPSGVGGVGHRVSCFAPEERSYAWEYNSVGVEYSRLASASAAAATAASAAATDSEAQQQQLLLPEAFNASAAAAVALRCGELNQYGCLNLDGCCSALRVTLEWYAQMVGLVALLLLGGLLVGV